MPSIPLCIQEIVTCLAARRVAPFGIAWLFARLQLPTHVSPLSASFFGTWPLWHPPNTFARLTLTSALLHECRQTLFTRCRSSRRLSALSRFGKIEAITVCNCQRAQASCPRQLESGNQYSNNRDDPSTTWSDQPRRLFLKLAESHIDLGWEERHRRQRHRQTRLEKLQLHLRRRSASLLAAEQSLERR